MKHRALVIGAGRIGAGFNWHDDEYTHAGAYRALSDRVELVGFVEPDLERRVKANLKWNVPTYDNVAIALEALKPDIISVCVQPDLQAEVYRQLDITNIRGIWQEKPFTHHVDGVPVQVNYMRRGDEYHRRFLDCNLKKYRLVAYGKDDIHTIPHFEDLADFWGVPLEYHVENGPCHYTLTDDIEPFEFPNGGFTPERTPGMAFKAMLGNLLDHIDNGTELWSPAL